MRSKQEWDIKRGSHLKILRMRKGLTQEYVAKKIGVNVASMQNWESGKICPSGIYQKPLAFLYSATIDELLSGEDAIEPPEVKKEVQTAEKKPEILDDRRSTVELVELLTKLTGKNRSDIIREAVKMYAASLNWSEVIEHYMEG